MRALTAPSGRTRPLYRWAVQPESARTHRPPEPRFHLGLASAAACTGDETKRGDDDDDEEEGKVTHLLFKVLCETRSHSHLDDAVHVRDEAVDADLQQHDQSPAHILTHFAVLVTGQRKQTLDTKEGKSEEEKGGGWYISITVPGFQH